MPLIYGNSFSSTTTTNTNHTNINHQKTPGTTFPPRISCLLFFQTLPFLFHLAAFRLPIDIRLDEGWRFGNQPSRYTAFADFKRPGLGDKILWNYFFGCLEICGVCCSLILGNDHFGFLKDHLEICRRVSPEFFAHPVQQFAKNGEKNTAWRIRDLGRCAVIKTSLVKTSWAPL